MKKIYTSREYKQQQKIQERRALTKKSRKSKEYKPLNYPNYVKVRDKKTKKQKSLTPPKKFQLLGNNIETLKFFDDFFRYIDDGYDKFKFQMKDVEELSIEVLLYIISLDKIYKEKIDIRLNIVAPQKKELKYIMVVSGFSKYFHANINIKDIDEETIFPICDGSTNRLNEKDDTDTCAEAVDFTKKYFDKSKHKEQVFRLLYTSLAELMLNTDNHAYDSTEEENTIDNWYLFIMKSDTKITFYFFDNGKGITKTARKKITEKAFGFITLDPTKILKSIFSGEFRTRTGYGHRGKGLPQINELLTNDKIGLSLVLTNKAFRIFEDNKEEYGKLPYNFKGSLFIWTMNIN